MPSKVKLSLTYFFRYNTNMFLAIDIGGTKTLLALFSHCGICLKKLKFSTSPSADTFSCDLKSHLSSFLPPFFRHRILATTVAIPGVVKIHHDSCQFSFGNLNWPNINLLSVIRSIVPGKIFFANDANLATLYEATRLGRRSGKSVYLTFSTGIGGGISKDAHLLPRSSSFEPGHVKYSFSGSTLEWEDIASAKALSELYNSPLSNLKFTADITSDFVSRLSLGLLDIIKLESPHLLIIGGPIALVLRKIKRPLLTYLANALNAPISSLPKILSAHRPSESVIYGAYLYSKQNHHK